MTTLALVCADPELLPDLASRHSIEVFPEAPGLLERTRHGPSSIGVAVLGPATPTPIEVARHLCALSDDLEILILCPPPQRSALQAQLSLTPWVGANVRCHEVGPDLAEAVERAIERTQLRRRNRAALEAAQWSLDHASPPPPSNRIVLEHFLQVAPVAVLLVTAEGLLVAANDRARALFPQAIPGAPLHPALQPFVARLDTEDAVRQAVVDLEDPRHVEVTASRVGPGQPVMLVVQDVSERLANEAKRRRLEERIQRTQKLESLAVLAGGVAHDFNNLLTTIIGNVDLTRRLLPAESPVLRRLDQVDLAAEKAADLSQQMLAYAGRGPTALESIDVNDVVADTIQIARAAISKNASLSVSLDQDLPACLVDVSQFRQVVISVVTNASEAIGEGPGAIRISTRVAAEAPQDAPTRTSEGPFVVLEVRDDGGGMDAEVLARVFDPFFSTKFAGRGLGLAAALGILRHHHGAVEVESEPGAGTSVRLFWPAAPGPRPAPAPAGAAEPPPNDRRWTGTVLLVDDEPALRDLLGTMLSEWGLTVLTAEDGVQALEVYEAHAEEVDLVVLDRTMPRMDGSQTFQELRRRGADVKVIMASGYSESPDDVHQVGRDGLVGFLQKPFSIDALKEALALVFAG